MNDNSKDRCRGALIGLAVGDALGAAVEFKRPGSFEPVTGYRAGGPHSLNAGEFTDDTSMALALADSMSRGWNLNDQAKQYLKWKTTGAYSVNGRCFDIGMTCSSALRRFEQNGNALASGMADERSSGNGSIMRLAPVPIKFHAETAASISSLAMESSMPTHASKQCLSACRYLAVVMSGLINGMERDEVLSPDWRNLDLLEKRGHIDPKVSAVVHGSYRTKQPPEIRGSGWVVESLEAALWAFHNADSFEEAVLRAVNLGDDADTTGAVCGQLAGAFFGESGISAPLRAGLVRQDMIEKALTGLGV